MSDSLDFHTLCNNVLDCYKVASIVGGSYHFFTHRPRALKKTETHPAGTLIETAANVAGMNRGELNRSFKVLYAFETQQSP